ncbi:hypothetical protein [Mycolicibacterium celeriflavum]|uniref:Uncharacterized protein n=1 Tax=Mycolicibacterium celeriflavum TaxID=1249101 RepID=A0A1X0C2V9_MYCCF|nr:hypothetical protein [Mycolicibacterium celeriflavum]MCV7239404.1 hypothetical protein [Mycolicibacterium celeriflavum]ORA51745.1 hypothetical protein BST21_01325 [Mycolicibacterium celeriflavum]BBY43095.1 hypothetical protein MCEL_13900 [Mycolicibacterium celeriflavum]
MTKPEERGSRGTGSDEPSGGPADRPSGTYEGDESVPSYDDGGKPDFETGFTNEPPGDVESELPPYEGRQTSAKADATDAGGARTGGAVKPATDAGYKGPTPGGGSTASPAEEQPAAQMPESDRGDDRVGPSHTAGTGRAEDKQ